MQNYKKVDALPAHELVETETFNEIFGKVSKLLECPTAFINEFMTFDDNVFITQILTVEEIVDTVQNSKDTDQDDDATLAPVSCEIFLMRILTENIYVYIYI